MDFEIIRPEFPKRAVVTAGMPYGNKLLHYGHVGMALRADIVARFLKDRIGKDNVIFVCGTDCYGSTSVESFRKLIESGDTRFATIEDYIEYNHKKQEEIFNAFDIVFDYYGASALGRSKEIHHKTSEEFIEGLSRANMLSKYSSWQFFDKKCNCLLNGRQVVGKCPIEGCQSEKGYADECGLGHQYLPQDLINPVSELSGETPILVERDNIYFDLDKCVDILREWTDSISKKKDTPSFMIKEINEFFKLPEVYLKREYLDTVKTLDVPEYEIEDKNPKAPSVTLIFKDLPSREKACEIFANHSIRYRTGKTLTPFRLTGDIEWGVPCPEYLGVKDKTFYVWPESLWAPISFTKTYLEKTGRNIADWKKFWCSKDSVVHQFLGEDNLYFYGPAQQAMFLSMQGDNPTIDPEEGNLRITNINPIKSILYMNSKASSSGNVKPPMAMDFLDHYTKEQFRMHFLAMNVTNNNVSLSPKAFDPNAKADELDSMVLEGNLLTNVYNRILRTIFYSTQKNFGGVIPAGSVSNEIRDICKSTILKYEMLMHDKKLHQVYNTIDVFIRNMNKHWAKMVNEADTTEKLAQLTIDTLQMIITADILLHPIVPTGSEYVADMIGLDKDKAFNWEYIFEDFYKVLDNNRAGKITEIKEKEDFFRKHISQLISE
ncbi:MAG: class I tRNA ligase family protein [Clostridia bacterium]|nr:class I tRNA ligase family protein [Clostridia bacterium]